MKFRSYGAEIVSDVALGQHEPDAYSAFELHRIQRSKHHRIQRAPASSPRVILVSLVDGDARCGKYMENSLSLAC